MAASGEREVDSDLGGCLEDLVPVQDNSPIILDGAAIVNMLRPDLADIFLFTIQVFLHHITTAIYEQTSCVG